MTKHSQIILIALCLCALFFNLTCKKESPVAPPQPTVPDTTSHNFTFQTFTFGGNAGSCVLSDVAIISDTNIWAVGAIYLDSADGEPDPFPYNVAHWDGQNWNLKQITVNYQGNPVIAPLDGIFAFSGTDIWMTNGFPIHGDGANWQMYQLQDMGIGASVSKAWGTSSSNIYFVGDDGSIVRYDGSIWTKISSGTSLTFNDIYGSGGQILAVCLQFNPLGGEIFSIQGNTATQISSNPIEGYQFYGIWFTPNEQYYIALEFGGVYEKHSLSDNSWNPLEITGAATTGVRGNGPNDVFVVSATGDFLHWNGADWKSFRGQTGLSSGGYARVAVNGNVVVAVGANSPQAVITMGRR